MPAKTPPSMASDLGILPGRCVVCQSTRLTPLLKITDVPVMCNALYDTREEALKAPRGNISLAFCEQCGHLFNASFDPDLMTYAAGYETSLHFSPHFQAYARALAANLVDRHGLIGKTIVEIGCGRGDFLRLLCDIGGNRGIGFDRSHVPDPDDRMSEGMTFVQDHFSDRYADCNIDLICCRHVLEHIRFPTQFLSDLRRAIGERHRTPLFFEVPNMLFTLKDLGIWDLIYEHCSYFCPSSLRYAFEHSGFDVENIAEAYAGQFLCIDATSAGGHARGTKECGDDFAKPGRFALSFAQRYRERVAQWTERLQQMMNTGQRAVIWGAGSKGISFLNIVCFNGEVDCLVDINPRKQNKHVPGSGHRVVSPEFLKTYRPDVILVMNPVYETEVNRQTLELGLSGQVVSV